MDNRLLTWEEIQDTHAFAVDSGIGHVTAFCKAQLAKADKEWVKWVEDTILFCDNPDCNHGNCREWQSRRKEIGL